MRFKNPGRWLSSGVFFGLLTALSLHGAPLLADGASPLNTRDQNPLLTIYGMPATVSGRLPAAGNGEWLMSLNLSNALIREIPGNEFLFVDVETYKLNLNYRYSLNQRWMLGLQLPFIYHGPGFMDDWIDRYHQALSLPEDIRPYFPNDEIHISYARGGGNLLSIQETTQGIGDLAIQIAYQASAKGDAYLSYWASLELPSGDAAKLTGSGSTDLALWLAVDRRMADDAWAYANLGALYMTESDVLRAIQKNVAWFASGGMQFHPWESVKLKLQLESHSAFYDSATEFLGPAILLSAGGSILYDGGSTLDLSISEDIKTGASPDVNFNISWRQPF